MGRKGREREEGERTEEREREQGRIIGRKER
jgi:hypothetical protein